MRPVHALLTSTALVAACPALAGDDLLWDNGIVPDGSNWARAISPPAFPDIRVGDDFVVPDGDTWVMRDFRFHVLEDAGWRHNDVVTLFIYEDFEGCPGPLLVQLETGFEQEFMGVFFDRDTYTYFLDPVEIELTGGKYWCGIRNPLGSGSGTSYWGSGDGGGRDGPTSDTGCFSLDAGESWTDEGPNWQHAFQIRGATAGRIPPLAFEITQGVRESGGTISLAASDDDHLVMSARRPSEVSRPSIELVVESRSPAQDIARLTIQVEASVEFENTPQWIDLFDFERDRWERVDEREASLTDQVVRVVVTQNPGRFVEPGTQRLRARVAYYDRGIPVGRWEARVDQVAWSVREP